MIKNRSLLLIWSLLGLNTSWAFNGYQLELIAFANINNNTLKAESWLPAKAKVYPPLSLPSGVERVDESDFIMQNEQDRLNHSGYRTLVHAAWRIPYADLNKITSFHIYGGRLFDDEGRVLQTSTDLNTPYLLSQHWEFNGNLQIKLSQYFDTRMSAALTLPNTNSQTSFMSLTINEHRKVKSQELNYLDHPLYGVIYKIVPVS
jgi:hypothetical protein